MLVAMGQPARYFWSKQIFVRSLSRWSIVACVRDTLFSPTSLSLSPQNLLLLRYLDLLLLPFHLSTASQASFSCPTQSCTSTRFLCKFALPMGDSGSGLSVYHGIRCQPCSQVDAACSLSQKSNLALCHPAWPCPKH